MVGLYDFALQLKSAFPGISPEYVIAAWTEYQMSRVRAEGDEVQFQALSQNYDILNDTTACAHAQDIAEFCITGRSNVFADRH